MGFPTPHLFLVETRIMALTNLTKETFRQTKRSKKFIIFHIQKVRNSVLHYIVSFSCTVVYIREANAI